MKYKKLAALFAVLVAVGVGSVPSAAGKTTLSELRVEGPNKTLDSGTWYANGPQKVRKSKPGDQCQRAKGRIDIPGRTPLSLVATGEETNRELSQVRVRRDEIGLFICEIGSLVGRTFSDPRGFAGWVYYRNYEFGSAGADQVQLDRGDQILWVYADFSAATPANTGSALELRSVPARTADGKFVVRVVEHTFDGSTEPASGATIIGAQSSVELVNGRYLVRVGEGFTRLEASRGSDIDSNQFKVCRSAELSECPEAHGRKIVGSKRDDELRGTRGWDRIRARGGDDVVSVENGGRDEVDCGGGDDKVILGEGPTDARVAGDCEKVVRR